MRASAHLYFVPLDVRRTDSISTEEGKAGDQDTEAGAEAISCVDYGRVDQFRGWVVRVGCLLFAFLPLQSWGHAGRWMRLLAFVGGGDCEICAGMIGRVGWGSVCLSGWLERRREVGGLCCVGLVWEFVDEGEVEGIGG